jgi:hypothetical protein
MIDDSFGRIDILGYNTTNHHVTSSCNIYLGTYNNNNRNTTLLAAVKFIWEPTIIMASQINITGASKFVFLLLLLLLL